MSASIRNFEKFFQDHPELSGAREAVMGRAQEASDQFGIISGGSFERILGPVLVEEFVHDLQENSKTLIEHAKIAIEDLRRRAACLVVQSLLFSGAFQGIPEEGGDIIVLFMESGNPDN